jgi:hypothetical protein
MHDGGILKFDRNRAHECKPRHSRAAETELLTILSRGSERRMEGDNLQRCGMGPKPPRIGPFPAESDHQIR